MLKNKIYLRRELPIKESSKYTWYSGRGCSL